MAFFLLVTSTCGKFAEVRNLKAEERLGTHLIRTVASLFTLRTHHNKDKEKEPETPLYQGYKPSYGASKPSYNVPKPSYNQPTYFAPRPSYDLPKPTYFQEGNQDEYGAPQAPLASSYESPKEVSLEYGAPDVGYTSYSPPVYKRDKAPALEEPHYNSGIPLTGSFSNNFPSFPSNFPSSSFSDGFGEFQDFPTPSFPDISAHLDGWEEWQHYRPQLRSSPDHSPTSKLGSSSGKPRSSPLLIPFEISDQLSSTASTTTSSALKTLIPGE